MVEVLPQHVVLAFVISFAIVFVIILSVHLIVKHLKHGRLRDIIRDNERYPSLALFQFSAWTAIIAFFYLVVYLIRVFGDVLEIPPAIPSNLLTLMGISVAVPVVSGGISAVKYRTKERPDKPHSFSTMLEEDDKPTLTRFQLFIWTWIGIAIYFFIFLAMLTKHGALQAVENLYLPDIDPTLVILMGISQGAYIGGKLIPSQAMEITRIVPQKATAEQTISLFGVNFGEVKDTIWFCFNDIAQRVTDIESWTNTRIDLKVPTGLKAGNYSIRVAKGERITPAKMFTVT